MESLAKLTSAGQISLPAEIRKRLRLSPGDFLQIEVTPDGRLLLSPKVLVPKDEAFFHEPGWREAEREAAADIAAGRVHGPFETAKELGDSLKKH